MPRLARSAPGGFVYHVTNRANGRNKLFEKKSDYVTFEQVLVDAMARVPTRVLGWCLMPDHWHSVVWPKKEGELSAFIRWLTVTHSQRLHSNRDSTGQGHVYQGRFRSFPIERAEPLLDVLHYVEGNGLRAKRVKRAEDWQWSSLWARKEGPDELRAILTEWPVKMPGNWVKRVNAAQSPAELAALRVAVRRSSPYGSSNWVRKTADKLNLQSTLRARGRPRLHPIKETASK